MKSTVLPYPFILSLILALNSLVQNDASCQEIEWIRQFGTSGFDGGYSAAADGSGNVYTSGSTTGNIGGPNAGARDFYIRKYDSTGGVLWTRQIGTTANDEGLAIATDKIGGVYVSGVTDGALTETNPGSSDAFLIKLDTSGNVLWTRQLGSAAGDSSRNVTPDTFGNVFIVGQTFGNLAKINGGSTDAFVAKYDSMGTLAWTRQFGASNDDTGLGVASDGQGGVYISGTLQARYAYLSRFDGSGNQLWQQTLTPGGVGSTSTSLAIDDAASVYVLGNTEGTPGWPHAGGFDVFVSKYTSSGSLLWRQHLGSANDDFGYGLSLDGLGRIYVSGQTDGDLAGLNAGDDDIFVTSWDTSGQFRWTRQFGTENSEKTRGVSADGLGGIYLAGSATGVLGASHAGSTDAFVIKLADVPEPSAVPVMMSAILCLSSLRRLRQR